MLEVDNIRLSTVVMAHPSRVTQAEQLRRRHPRLDIRTVLDPEPDGKPATLRTAKLAWAQVPDDATHHMVLQEDVQLCENFEDVVIPSIQAGPSGGLAFYSDWIMATSQAVRLAAFAGGSWTPVIDFWLPTQALVLPCELARQFPPFADGYPQDKPDNVALAEFLNESGVSTYVSVPNLVEHRPTQSLLLNDLSFGVRHSTVFATSRINDHPLSSAVIRPPAIAHLGLGDFESYSHYESLADDSRIQVSGNEVLVTYGISRLELAELFFSDLGYHAEALETGFGESLLFQPWQAMFLQGVIARGIAETANQVVTFDEQLTRSPWALPALKTFAAGALRRTCPVARLGQTADLVTPLCITGMRSGFNAIEHWPQLKALWDPARYDIRPRWNSGQRNS